MFVFHPLRLPCARPRVAVAQANSGNIVHEFRGFPLISAILQLLGAHLVCHSRNAARRALILALAFFFVPIIAMAQQASTANSGSWSGVIINSGCSADEAFNEDAKCFADVPGAKLSFYDD